MGNLKNRESTLNEYEVTAKEIDKIKNYAQHEKVSNDVAFDDLYLNGILNIEKDIYHGSAWIDIPREPLEYVFSFLDKNPNWYKLFQTSAWPDESLFQTILCNSKYKENIINDSHRYISWKKKYNNYPAILDISDYDNIKRSNSHFARKIDKNISKELIEKIQKELMI